MQQRLIRNKNNQFQTIRFDEMRLDSNAHDKKEYTKKVDEVHIAAVAYKRAVAAHWSAGKSSKSSSTSSTSVGGPAKKAKAAKVKLALSDMSKASLEKYCPKAKSCRVFYEAFHDRVRATYEDRDGTLHRTSAAIKLHGEQAACRDVLNWLWDWHSHETGEVPSFVLLSA